MSEKNRYSTKRIFGNVLWSLLGMGTVILLGAAISKKNNMRCRGIDITIRGVQNNFFIDKKEVQNIIEKINGGKAEGKGLRLLNLSQMETVLQKNEWIKKAELFFDNNEILRVDITEREPVARVFTKGGALSFYIDTSLTILPLSDKFSARVPVFTNFPSDKNLLVKEDSALLKEIKNISNYILSDPFWMAQIDQIDITENRTFEMIPKVGNQIIAFGSGENYQQKFDNLLIFYKQVLTKVGWNKYSKINVQYKGQIVAVKRGVQDVIEDSLRAKQIMQTMIANALKQSSDSINNIQLVQTQDDNNIPVATQTEDFPGEQTTVVKSANNLSDKNILPQVINNVIGKNENLQPPIITPNPMEKTIADKPRTTNTTLSVKKLKPTKNLSSSIEKPNPNPQKKTIIKSSLDKLKSKPKAMMPPKNDY